MSIEDALINLDSTIRKLLSLSGCPWDRSQTLKTLAPYLVEESWEFLHATKSMDNSEMAEELGDVLMLVFLACAIAEKENRFSLQETTTITNEKLIRRHPHVFDNVKVSGTEEIKQNWETIKREKEGRKTEDDGLPHIPASFPALKIAMKLGKSAAKLGFEWPDLGGPLAKISEEWEELKEAIAKGQINKIEAEVGDFLFAITNICRFLKIDPELALRESCSKFRKRFGYLTRNSSNNVFNNLAEMENNWKKAKEEENDGAYSNR